MVQKWNEQLHSYESYALPEGASLYEEDMDKIVSCAACGKQIAYGDGYTSLQIHNRMGIGYAVCESCHEAEIETEIKWRRGGGNERILRAPSAGGSEVRR